MKNFSLTKIKLPKETVWLVRDLTKLNESGYPLSIGKFSSKKEALAFVRAIIKSKTEK